MQQLPEPTPAVRRQGVRMPSGLFGTAPSARAALSRGAGRELGGVDEWMPSVRRCENMVGVNMVPAEFVKFKLGLYNACCKECFEGILLESCLLQPCFHVAGPWPRRGDRSLSFREAMTMKVESRSAWPLEGNVCLGRFCFVCWQTSFVFSNVLFVLCAVMFVYWRRRGFGKGSRFALRRRLRGPRNLNVSCCLNYS